ncbi:alpha/beta hydrolase [Actinocatenispora sera]|nr:alpha/beta fold hydrolase [Actinocatenispora sera]
MRGIRLAFGAAERFAPALGGRRAALLWCTPPHGRGRRRDDRPALPSRHDTLSTGHGRRLAVQSWGPERAAPVYLVHGWGGWRGQLGRHVEPLVATGHRVVAFDSPSHGDSGPGVLGPHRSTAPEMVDALTDVVAHYGAPAGILAHSLGCATSLVALSDGLPAAPLAFVAPAADPLARIGEFTAALGAGERVEAALRRRLEALGGRPLADFAVTEWAAPQRPPLLVVHDRDDRETSYEQGRQLAERWPGGELTTTTGLGHLRILRDAAVIDRVTGFLTSR